MMMMTKMMMIWWHVLENSSLPVDSTLNHLAMFRLSIHRVDRSGALLGAPESNHVSAQLFSSYFWREAAA